MKNLVWFVLAWSLGTASYAKTPAVDTTYVPRTFIQAKEVLPDIYSDMKRDFYCDCAYTGKKIDFNSCGYTVRKQRKRALAMEWEHVVPASIIGKQKACWQAQVNGKAGGRKHCTRSDPSYAHAEGDLVNLVPSVGEINSDRQNFRYAVWADAPTPMYGRCQTIIDFQQGRIQPRKEIRGRIARIQFYMSERYQLPLSKEEKRVLCVWANAYPIDQWERVRDQRIQAIQGSGNRYVTDENASKAFCQ